MSVRHVVMFRWKDDHDRGRRRRRGCRPTDAAGADPADPATTASVRIWGSTRPAGTSSWSADFANTDDYLIVPRRSPSPGADRRGDRPAHRATGQRAVRDGADQAAARGAARRSPVSRQQGGGDDAERTHAGDLGQPSDRRARRRPRHRRRRSWRGGRPAGPPTRVRRSRARSRSTPSCSKSKETVLMGSGYGRAKDHEKR